MTRSRILCFLALAALPGTAAYGQKVAYVDMQGALMSTQDGQNASSELKRKFSPKEDDFSKRKAAIDAKQAQYQKTLNTLSPAARAAAEREIESLGRQLQRDNDDAQQEFQQEENRLLSPILQKMQQIINKYAADNQIGLVVDASRQPNNLLYADPSTDVTKPIVDLYNKSAAAAPAAPVTSAPKPPAAAPAKPPVPASPKPPGPKQ